MNFILLLLALVAFCHANLQRWPTSGRNVNVGEDGTIVITGANGKRITISTKDVGANGRIIDISAPDGFTKRIQIDDSSDTRAVNVFDTGRNNDVSDEFTRDKRSSRGKKSSNQVDTLSKIVSQFEGGVDDAAYQQLLRQVGAAVQSGKLDGSVYEILFNLEEGKSQAQESQQPSQQQDQDIVGNRLQGQYNILELLRKQGQQNRFAQPGAQGYATPYGQQQSLYGQGDYSRYGQQALPVTGAQSLVRPQMVSYSPAPGLAYGLEGAVGPAVSYAYTALDSPVYERPFVQVPVDTYNAQLLNEVHRPLNQYVRQVVQSTPAQLQEIIQEVDELRGEQRRIQQQVSQQQYLQEQQMLQQGLQVDYQPQLQQLPKQLQQQFAQQKNPQQQYLQQQYRQQQQQYLQYQPQQQYLEQQKPYTTWRDYFLRPSQYKTLQGQRLLQQQQGYYHQSGLNGEYAQPRYNSPVVY